MKVINGGEARIVKRKLMELSELENGLKIVRNRLVQANLRPWLLLPRNTKTGGCHSLTLFRKATWDL